MSDSCSPHGETIPVVLLGVLFEHAIDTHLRNLWVTVIMLVA